MKRLMMVIAVAVGATIPASSLSAQGIESEIEQVSARLQAAFSTHLHLFSPRNYDDASQKLADARTKFERGERIQDIRRALSEARASLEKAEKLEDVGNVLLRGAMEARGLALEANAPAFAAAEWDKAEKKIRDAGEQIEDGDQNDARSRASEAEQLYNAAEYQAIREDLIGNARQLRAAAIDAGANDRARVTLAHGDSLLGHAERILAEDRYRRAEAGQVARVAANAFQRAARIARRANQVDDDTNRRVEALILDYEGWLAEIAQLVDLQPTFAEGPRTEVDEIATAITSLKEERRQLRDDVSRLEREFADAQRVVDSLTTQLVVQRDSLGALLAAETESFARQAAEEARQRQQTASALRAREERRQTIDEIRGMFSPEEAEVVVRGEELVIRMRGLNFRVGSAEVAPENFPLLTRVQRAMRRFPGAPVQVAGHTDSQGNEAYNQALSERRAQAVAAYLIANTEWTEDLVTAVGYGESQPVASNDTAAGRAQNRRIDIIINMPSLSA